MGMSRSALRASAAACAALLTAVCLAGCGGQAPAAPPQQAPAQPAEPPTQVLVLTEADVGRHLKATDWAVGVMEWIGELQDRTLAALPRRALWNDGRIFVPTAESASGETFWLHVVTDQSAEQAQAWVRYLAAQPPSAALGFTSPEHRLFEAVRGEPPQLGGAALAVRLLHGNAGGRYRTELIIFAQDGAIVILCNTRAEDKPPLTVLPAIAELISKRLSSKNSTGA